MTNGLLLHIYVKLEESTSIKLVKIYFQSTYCSNMVKHCETLRRTVHVVNLDPAAEHFDYPVLVGKLCKKKEVCHAIMILNIWNFQKSGPLTILNVAKGQRSSLSR